MQTIEFVLRSRAGSFQEGSLTGESGNTTIFLQTGDQVSLHLARHQVAGYEREGSNLIIKLADGREIVLGSFVSNLLAVAIALFALQVYDRVIPHQSEATLWVLAFGAFIALIMEAALKIARSRLIDQSGRQIEKARQTVLMERLLGMRLDLMQRSPSQLFSAMREFGSIREFFTASAVGTLADIPFILIFLILVYSIGGPVVGVLIVGGVLMVLPSLLLRNHVMQSTQQMQNVSAQSNRVLHEILGNLETVKTQRAEDRFRKLWAKLGDETADRASSLRGLASVLTFWSQAVQQATYIAAVVACTHLVFAGDLTVGAIIAVSILTSRTLAPLTQLSSTLSRWSNVKAALDSLGNIIEAPKMSPQTNNICAVMQSLARLNCARYNSAMVQMNHWFWIFPRH